MSVLEKIFDDVSWDKERRSIVFTSKITHITCRKRVSEKVVKMSYSERQELQHTQKERCLSKKDKNKEKEKKNENLFLIVPRLRQRSR